MRGLRRLKLLALAALIMTAAGCATVQPAPSPATQPSAPADAASKPTAAGPATTSVAQAPQTSPASAASTATDAPEGMTLQAALAENDTALQPKYGNIWERIRAGFAIPDMDGEDMTPYVDQARQWYGSRPDYVARMTDRSRKYLYYIVQEVQRRGMPTELALLPFVESAFNPAAQSTAKASGMWQFIPSTGTRYNLQQNMFADGRRDVMASTKAALDYLTKLHDMFGDWQLALAAYNWGEGGVQRAVAINTSRGLPAGYGDIRMPAETRNYYPKLQAVKDIIADPAKYGITLPDVPDHPYFKPVTLTQDIDVNVAARLAGISESEFRSLNPSFRKPVIIAAAHPRILLPYDNATTFEQSMSAAQSPLSSWTTYSVRRTATPEQIAHDLNVAEATLRDVNKIPARTLVKAGSTLLVPKTSDDDQNVSASDVENAVLALAPESPALKLRHVHARRGDTTVTIARRYGVSPDDVARWNHVASRERLRVHTELVVYTPTTSGRPARRTVVAQDGSTTATPSGHRSHRHGVRVASRRVTHFSSHESTRRDVHVAQR